MIQSFISWVEEKFSEARSLFNEPFRNVGLEREGQFRDQLAATLGSSIEEPSADFYKYDGLIKFPPEKDDFTPITYEFKSRTTHFDPIWKEKFLIFHTRDLIEMENTSQADIWIFGVLDAGEEYYLVSPLGELRAKSKVRGFKIKRTEKVGKYELQLKHLSPPCIRLNTIGDVAKYLEEISREKKRTMGEEFDNKVESILNGLLVQKFPRRK